MSRLAAIKRNRTRVQRESAAHSLARRKICAYTLYVSSVVGRSTTPPATGPDGTHESFMSMCGASVLEEGARGPCGRVAVYVLISLGICWSKRNRSRKCDFAPALPPVTERRAECRHWRRPAHQRWVWKRAVGSCPVHGRHSARSRSLILTSHTPVATTPSIVTRQWAAMVGVRLRRCPKAVHRHPPGCVKPACY
jgi:hypothetical protein